MHALEQGFAEVALDTHELVETRRSPEAAEETISHLRAGRSVIVHTCRGGADIRFASIKDRTAEVVASVCTGSLLLAGAGLLLGMMLCSGRD